MTEQELLEALSNFNQSLRHLSERVSNIEFNLIEMQRKQQFFSPQIPIEQTKAGQHLQQLGIPL